MNKNRKCASLIQKSIATATMASVLFGNVANAGSVVTSPRGALAGVMAATAQIHEKIIENQSHLSEGLKGEASEWDDRLMADVTSYLNVRSMPAKSGEVIGRMRASDIATVLGQSEEWYQIRSGEVEGFVYSDYCLVGKEAKAKAEEICKTFAICKVKTLNIRSEASTDSEIIGTLGNNDIAPVIEELSAEGWIKIKVEDAFGYVSMEFVDIETGELGSAMTAEEIEAEEAAAAEEARKKAEEEAARAQYNPAVAASVDEETLLAALLMCEAGSSYDGMLAVGGVVINRLRAGYAGSIRDVIYQRGQFTPAYSGQLDRQLANGVSETALQAARDAISGIDITGGCKSFRAASTGHPGINIGGNVFF